MRALPPGHDRDGLRNQLVERFLPAVRKIAAGLCARTPECVEFDELYSAGVMGLMGAVESFDPEIGVRFRTYADRRIRGAMIDGMREMDFVPRMHRRRISRMLQAGDVIYSTTGTKATDEQCAARAGIPWDKAQRELRDDRRTYSLNEPLMFSSDGESIELGEMIPDREPERSRQQRIYDALLRGLSRSQQMIVRAMYESGCNMHDTGRAVGISESRVSQMHAAIIARLRARMDGAAA